MLTRFSAYSPRLEIEYANKTAAGSRWCLHARKLRSRRFDCSNCNASAKHQVYRPRLDYCVRLFYALTEHQVKAYE